MEQRELTSMELAYAEIDVKRVQQYLDAFVSVAELITSCEKQEKEWCRARCNAILTDARKRFYSRMNGPSDETLSAWSVSFGYLTELFWTTLSPGPEGSHTELICRIKKAHGLALMLSGMLSGLLATNALRLLENIEKQVGTTTDILRGASLLQRR